MPFLFLVADVEIQALLTQLGKVEQILRHMSCTKPFHFQFGSSLYVSELSRPYF